MQVYVMYVPRNWTETHQTPVTQATGLEPVQAEVKGSASHSGIALHSTQMCTVHELHLFLVKNLCDSDHCWVIVPLGG